MLQPPPSSSPHWPTLVSLLSSSIAVASLIAVASAATVSSTSSVVAHVKSPLPDCIGHNLGAYSPYYEYPAIPRGCSLPQVSLCTEVCPYSRSALNPAQYLRVPVNILERHGARFESPLARSFDSPGKKIAVSVAKLKNATSFAEEVEFVKDYVYNLGADDLTRFGAYQSYQHGELHWTRYGHPKAEKGKGRGYAVPFIRSDSSQRAVDSAGNWSEGFSFHGHQTT